MKREAEEKALRDKLAGKASGGASSGGSAFAKKPQNPALPAGLQDMLGDSGELPPNLVTTIPIYINPLSKLSSFFDALPSIVN